jgi:anthranilate phosphoribosyltransferase
VVRHAARAVSSNCGAIDVIEALGVNVDSAPELPKQSIEHAGIGAWNALTASNAPARKAIQEQICDTLFEDGKSLFKIPAPHRDGRADPRP